MHGVEYSYSGYTFGSVPAAKVYPTGGERMKAFTMATDSSFSSSALGGRPKRSSDRFLKRLWVRVGAFWSQTRVARVVLLVVLLPLLALFHRPVLSWLRQPYWPHLTQNVIEFLTLYLAASGILYAIIHEMRLGEHVRQLRAIEASLSTRRLGRFPHYLEEIRKLLDGANKLMILADCADYGSFFAPDEHEMLHDAVCRFSRVDGNKAQILVAGPPAAFTAASSWSQNEYIKRYRTIIREYWPKYIKAVRADYGFLDWLEKITDGSAGSNPRLALFTEWLSSCGSKEPDGLRNILLKTKSVCDEHGRLQEDNASANAFLMLLQTRQYRFEKLLGAANVDIRHAPQPTSLFFWISQETNEPAQAEEGGIALFAFPNPHRTDGRGALAFRTIDPDLIRTFEGIFEKMWPLKERSTPCT